MKQPHILCEPDDIAESVLLPGDPARVLRVAEYLDNWKEIAFNREFRTITGTYKGKPVSVTSSGIGGASAVIAMEELIACGAKKLIRIGSSGAVQPGIAIGDLVIPVGAVREDGASKMYVSENYPAIASPVLFQALCAAAEENDFKYHTGIIRSHDSFYIDNEREIMSHWNKKGIIGSDMETATLMVLGTLRGVQVASILNNVVLYEGDVKEGISDYVDSTSAAEEGERREILAALEAVTG